jgi:chemotaxis protein MotB
MAEDNEQQEIIIVRRHGAQEEGHHGGAWKIAYADFVTAMMAFFLVLWILNSTNKDSQTIIARYFNPVKMEDFSKNKKGIRDDKQADSSPQTTQGEPDKSPPPGQQDGKMEQKGKDPAKDINAKSLMNEETLFQNPYAALEQIAGKAPAQKKKAAGAASEAGSTDAYRDPFRAAEGAASDDDGEGAPDEAQAASAPTEAPAKEAAGKPASGKAQPNPQQAAQAAHEAQDAADKADAESLQKQLAGAAKAAAGDNAPKFDVKATQEGLLISLTDNEKFGMFETGSSQPAPQMVHLMERIAQMLKNRPGRLVLRGFTDARPFRNGTSDNWRLSASRAEMAHFMLARGGLDDARIERIEAYADRRPRNVEKPDSAENRRIEILLRKAAP